VARILDLVNAILSRIFYNVTFKKMLVLLYFKITKNQAIKLSLQ